MSWGSWTIVMVQDGPGIIPEDVRAELTKAACELHLKKMERMQMRGGVCEGVIQTNGETASLGARTGVLFRSQFDWESGGCKVNFLLSEEDLENGATTLRRMMEEREGGEWLLSPEPFPVPELYDFHDLRGPRRLH